MSDWDVPSVHKMYSVAYQCLNEKKNRRPDIKMVCSLSDKRFILSVYVPLCGVIAPVIYISICSLAGPTASARDKNLIRVSSDIQKFLKCFTNILLVFSVTLSPFLLSRTFWCAYKVCCWPVTTVLLLLSEQPFHITSATGPSAWENFFCMDKLQCWCIFSTAF